MADVNANIGVHIDTSAALAELKNLQRQLATFHASIVKGSAASAAAQRNLQTNLLNAINATGSFTAQMGVVRTSTESFTHSLEKNNLSMRDYFRYAGGATKTFGRLFKQEFDTIGKVAEERVKKMQTQYIKMGRDADGAMRAMAITPRTLDMKNYATQSAIAAQKQALFNQLVRQGSTNLLNFGKNTQWAGRQLMVGFTVPLAYLGTAAAKTFMELEKQAIRFKRVYGDMFTTGDETNKALKEIEDLAKSFTKYGVAVTKTMEMAADAAAMGKTGADLTAQVAQATRLAVLGGVEQAEALETTISVTNAFGVAAEDLAKKINFLNAVENQTVVSIEDLTIAIPKAGPVVKQLGGDVEDLAFFLTAMKEGGINASEGANALKSGLASLINPAEKSAKFLAELGININSIVESNAGDVKNTVIEFAQALDTLDPLNRARAIEQLFGKFQFSRLSTLFQNVTKDGTQASRVLQIAGSSMEQLAILSERELKTLENAVGVQFKAAVEDLKVSIAPIGKTFLEAVTPIVKAVAGILEKFNGLSDGTKKVIVVATTLVGIIGPTLLMTFGLLANGVANIIKLFLAMRVGFLKLGGNTKILAEQTSYMTTEQLEAATVAASLNQAHTRLTQSFTAETSAVRLLRQAYIDATIAATKFAVANPGMIAPKKGSAPKKFARGATYVPGIGNKDTVPSILTPGEAVIPKDVAQDPRFQPIIDAMVNGNLQAFNGGETNVTQSGKKSKKSMSPTDDYTHVGRSDNVRTQDYLKETSGLTEYDKARIRLSEGIQKSMGKDPTVGSYGGLGFAFDKKLNINLAKPGGISIESFEKEWLKKGPEKWDVTGSRQVVENLHGKDNRVVDDAMLAKIKEEAAKNNGRVTDNLVKKAFEDLPASVKTTTTYKSMDGSLRGKAEYGITGISPNPYKSKAALEKAVQLGLIPKAPVVMIDGDALEYNGKPTPMGPKGKQLKLSEVLGTPGFEYPKGAHSVVKRTNSQGKIVAGSINGYDPRFPNDPINLSSGSRRVRGNIGKRPELKALLEVKKRLSKRSVAELRRIDADVRSSSMAKVKPTDFGKLVSPTSGRSFPVAGIGGVYEKDGKKVFVKPMIDERSAKAELRANEIARKVHGLDTPEQVMKVMADPNNKKRKIIVLESAFNPKFAEDNIKKTFTKGEYFKQLVAANLRADADLKKGNLGGNVLTDPGAAGVFDRASGRRDFAKQLPSMLEMAEKNLSGVKGGAAGRSPYWFGNETVSIAKNMTADQYHNAMNAEIDKALKKLEPTVAGFGITDPEEKRVYQAMIDRLKQGKKENWRALHAKHSSLLVKPDEMLEDEKGKQTKPKTTGKPSGVKSSSGKLVDSKLTDKPKKGQRIVNVAKRGPRGFIVPGKADAPLSQADQIRQRAAQEGISTSTARRRLIAEGKLVEGIKKQSSAIDATTKSQTITKEQLNKFNQRAGIGIGAMTGLTVAASFADGKLGEMATSIMPFVFALQGIHMLLPLLKNPWVAAIAAIIAVGGFMLKLARDVENARKAGVDLAKSMNMTSDKLQRLSEITGTVSATEEADRKRQTTLTGEDAVQRKFGQNILGSEFGKSLLADIEKQAKSGQGIEQIGKNISNSLAYAIVQGVITTDQAKSIASALGEELKSYEIPAIISGRLTTLLGPNGENLATDPLQVTLAIQEESMTRQADFFKTALEQSVSTTTFTNLGQVIGGSIIAGIGATIAVGTGFTGVGAVAGGAIAAAGGTIVGQGLSDQNEKKEVNASLGAAALQLGLEQVAMNNGLVDSLNKQYDIKVKMAKTDAEIKAIEDERKAALDTLNAKNSEALKILIAQKDAFGPDIFTKGINAAIDTLYKDGPMKVFADEAKKELEKVGNANFKAMLQVQFASGALDPITVTKLANNETLQTKFTMLIDTANGTEGANLIMQLLMKAGADETRLSVFLDILNNDPDNFDKNMKAIEVLANMQQKYGITIDVNDDGAQQLKEIVAVTEKLAGITGEELTKQAFLDLGITGNMTGPEFDKLWTTLVGTSSTINKSVIVDFVASGNRNVVDAYMTAMGIKKAPAGFDRIQSQMLEKDAAAWNVGRQGKFDANGNPIREDTKDTKTKSRDTTFDSILTDLKRTRDATIDAQGGAKELIRILSGKKDLQVFKGIDQQLSKIGANSDFIDFIGGVEKAIQNNLIKISKKGVVSLTELGKASKKAYDEKQLGLFSSKSAQAINEAQKQRAGFVKLKTAGVESADAVEMLADATFMVSLAAQKNPAEIKRMIDQWKVMRKEISLTAATTNPQAYLKEQIDRMRQIAQNQKAIAENIYENETAAAKKTIESNEVIIEQKQRLLETDKEIGSRKIASINEEIDRLQKQLEDTIDKDLALFQNESSMLAEDQIIISNSVDKINQKYDLQAESLSKIAEINQEIISQQRGQVSLADALSSGDMSAAANAMQQIREQSAAAAAKRAEDALEAARQKEINSVIGPRSQKTSQQISERQYEIDRRIFKLNEDRSLVEAQITTEQNKLYAIEQKRKAVVADITKLEDDNYDLDLKIIKTAAKKLQDKISELEANERVFTAIDLAQTNANLKADGFNDKIFDAKGLLGEVAGLWSGLTDKNLQINITKIEEVIRQYGSWAKAGTIETATGPVDVNSSGVARDGSVPIAIPKAPFNPMYPWLPRAAGGFISGPGTSTSDSIPALLSDGEYVIKADSVKKYGIGMLNTINAQKFKDGGPAYADVNPSRVGSTTAGGSSSSYKNPSSAVGMGLSQGFTSSLLDFLGIKGLQQTANKLFQGGKNKGLNAFYSSTPNNLDYLSAALLPLSFAASGQKATAKLGAKQSSGMFSKIAAKIKNSLKKTTPALQIRQSELQIGKMLERQKGTDGVQGGINETYRAILNGVPGFYKTGLDTDEVKREVFGGLFARASNLIAPQNQAVVRELNGNKIVDGIFSPDVAEQGAKTLKALMPIRPESLMGGREPFNKVQDAAHAASSGYRSAIMAALRFVDDHDGNLTLNPKTLAPGLIDFGRTLDYSPFPPHIDTMARHLQNPLFGTAGSFSRMPELTIPYFSGVKKGAEVLSKLNEKDITKMLKAAGYTGKELKQKTESVLSSVKTAIQAAPEAESRILKAQESWGTLPIGMPPIYSGGAPKIDTDDLLKKASEGLSFLKDTTSRKGNILLKSKGGLVPKYFADGGYARGTDTVPAMLTPGEFVMTRSATNKFKPILENMNSSNYPSMVKSLAPATYNPMNSPAASPMINSISTNANDNSTTMYNYSVGINVGGSNSSPDEIARAVMTQIKYIDSQRIRGQR